MNEIQLSLNEKGHGAFYLMQDDEKVGEMIISTTGGHLTVYHTEVSPLAEGKGLAGKLLGALVDYARQHAMKILPLCSYVYAQFKRHPQEYQDVWMNDEME